MRKWLAVVAVVFSFSVSLAAETPEELDARLERELAAKDPQALVLWKQANAARSADRSDEAIRLYAQVYARVPSFVHALRRQAYEESRLGRHEDAEAHGRQAVAQERSALNLSSLAFVLLERSGSHPADAAALAREALALDPDEPGAATALAMAGQKAGDLDMIREATTRLERVAPKDPQTHLFSAPWP